MTIVGLVLQGGGALGAFELGAIECLLDSDIRPDIVSGVSIGAINAATLCGHRDNDPKISLRNLWRDLTTMNMPFQPDLVNQNLSLLGCPGMYQPRSDYWDWIHWTSFYDTSPLLSTLETHVNFDKLGPSRQNFAPGDYTPRLILTATNIYTGKLETFDSTEMAITPQHVRASGSLPPGFPATIAPAPPHSGGAEHLYWDGGLFDNTPLTRVIGALQEFDDPDKQLYVISLFPCAVTAAPTNMHEVFTRMMTLSFSHKMDQDVKRAKKTTELIRFTDELDQAIDTHRDLEWLKDLSGYKVLKGFKVPLKIVEIVNPSVSGASDFSAEGIERRREAGYQMTAAQLEMATSEQ